MKPGFTAPNPLICTVCIAVWLVTKQESLRMSTIPRFFFFFFLKKKKKKKKKRLFTSPDRYTPGAQVMNFTVVASKKKIPLSGIFERAHQRFFRLHGRLSAIPDWDIFFTHNTTVCASVPGEIFPVFTFFILEEHHTREVSTGGPCQAGFFL